MDNITAIAGRLKTQWVNGNREYVRQQLNDLPREISLAVMAAMCLDNDLAYQLYKYFMFVKQL